MSTASKLKTNSELLLELERLPPHLSGEVIDGTLYTMGRPSAAHQQVEGEIYGKLRFGGPGGPGGAWSIFTEVAVRFPSTQEEVVPDVSGWRAERLPDNALTNPIEIRPDWVCEVLSDSTRRKDLGPKRALYARQDISHLWVVDPAAQVFEVFELDRAAWRLLGTWSDQDVVEGPKPFVGVTFELARWWRRMA